MKTASNAAAFDLPRIEEEVRAYWSENDVIPAHRNRNLDAEAWTTVEGPPTVNGRPALHHVWTSVYKDVYGRYKSARGFRVSRRGGWDCQGLPIEIAVERRFGMTGKKDIEIFGIENFVRECEILVQQNIEAFEAAFDRAAYWVDMDHAYKTMEDKYIESVWSHLKVMADRGLLYESERIVPYCLRCGTALSSHELGQPGVYREVEAMSAYVAMESTDASESYVVWTTTPWSLPGNMAIAVHPEITYGRFRIGGKLFIVAEDRGDVLGPDAELVDVVKGADLVGRKYRAPYATSFGEDVHTVLGAPDLVRGDAGTGIVHVAPSFGEEDFELCERAAVRRERVIDGQGAYVFGQFAGQSVPGVGDLVLDDLTERGLLVAKEEMTHSYPHCWRCDTPLIYWAKPEWFVRTTAVRDAMRQSNGSTVWHPESIGRGRFGNWLENNVDWAISRDRYWGTPLPIWRCSNGHTKFFGTVAELATLAPESARLENLHRPFIDEIKFKCPECGDVCARVAPVADVWLDSGCAPGAQFNLHPSDYIGATDVPVPLDFVCEAIDQTRGWFYSLLAVSTLVYEEQGYKNVVCLGHLVDEQGRKMSKSLGNVLDADELMSEFGADGIRWYLFTLGAPWGPRHVDKVAIRRRLGQDLGTLWNVARFYNEYADSTQRLGTDLAGDVPTVHPLDQWIVSRTVTTIKDVETALDTYQAHSGAACLSTLIDDLSNWYVRRSRSRFWDDETATEASTVLGWVLARMSLLMAPFVPHFSEWLWQLTSGGRRSSVHLNDWLPPDPTQIDTGLERDMDLVRRIVGLGRTVRTRMDIPVKQPLPRLMVYGSRELEQSLEAEIRAELNVAEIDWKAEQLERNLTAAPNWRLLGKKHQRSAPKIAAEVQRLSPAQLESLLSGESVTLTTPNLSVRLDPEDVQIAEGFGEDGQATASDAGIQVTLDTTITPELRKEFEVRSLIRAIQVGRKAAGMAIAQRIVLTLDEHFAAEGERIGSEVLASEVNFGTAEAADYRGDSFSFVIAPQDGLHG